MALSGSFSGQTSNTYIKPTIKWVAEQNEAENYSDVTATLYYSRTNKGYTTQGTWSGRITIAGESTSDRKHLEITYNSNTKAITATVRVYHDDYGAKSLTISASGSISGTTLESTSISAKITLDTIPRASTISASDANIESRSTVVVNRKNATFTHSIAYAFGDLSGYIKADGTTTANLTRISETTINMLLPSSFYGQIPDDPSAECTLTCTTWSGTKQIGQAQTTKFAATAAKNLCVPTVSGSVQDVNSSTVSLTGDKNKLIRFSSTARCTISATARNGARIVDMKIGGKTPTNAILDIPNVDVAKVVFQATDSRGYTSKKEINLNLISYVKLTNNATVQRTDPTSGKATLVLKGNCWKGNFGAVSNALQVTYKVGTREPVTQNVTISDKNTYSLSVDLSGLDYQKSHTIQVTVKDKLDEKPKTLTVNKGIPVFDWGEEDFRFNVPVNLPGLNINGKSLADYIRSIMQGG